MPHNSCNNIQRDFECYWSEFQDNEINQVQIRQAKRFLKPIIQLNKTSLKILDIGCGSGVHLKILNGLNKDHQITGIDISRKSIDICQKRFSQETNINLVRGSALKLPFKDKKFDVVFSFGVIGYTLNPQKAFQEKVRVLKDNGLLGIWVYPQKRGLAGLSFHLARKICQKSKWLAVLVINLTVPLLQFLPVSSKIHLGNSSWKKCLEVVKVNLQPRHLHFFQEKELKRMFRSSNLKIIYQDEKEKLTIWGRKVK